mmetsp:Transcript_38578/g.123998  ORF Transcript_38578/g.123998 Transcript_38578/m.123998 type:complete len:179 (-) Transcript_38578:3-539(-)
MVGTSRGRQAEEMEALQAIFAGEGEFELLVDPSQGDAEVVFRVQASVVAEGCVVQVTLPAGYPTDESPRFAVQGLRASHAGQLSDALAAKAEELRGDECMFEVLQSLEELASGIEGLQTQAAPEQQVDVGAALTEETQAEAGKWSWAIASGARARSWKIEKLRQDSWESGHCSFCLLW